MKFRHLILACTFSAISFVCNGQTASDKASKECCDCIKKLPKNLSESDLRDRGMECMSTALIENLIGLCKEYGYKIDEMNEETGRKIGERFGTKLVTDCPASAPIFMSIGVEELKKGEEGNISNFTKQEGEMVGTIASIETDGILTKVNFITTDKQKRSLYWTKSFPGDQILVKSTWKNKKMKLAYGRMEYYNSTNAKYDNIMVILELKPVQ